MRVSFVCLLLGLAACGAASDDDGALSSAGAVVSADDEIGTSNPIVPESQGGVADPGVARDDDGQYWMVSTGGSHGLYPIRQSADLVHWTHVGYVFPGGSEPTWYAGNPWAPELHRLGDRWAVVFSATSKSTNKMAIGIATSTSPNGPFTERGSPLLAETPIGGIDPSLFHDPADGRDYLIWKQESNGLPPNGTPIWIQALDASTLTLVGNRTELIRNNLPWESSLVEGPWMVARDGWYYVFYAANAYFDYRYATGVARARSPLGPFEKHGTPILSSTADDCWQGPGHGSVVTGPDGSDVFVFHAWEKGHTGSGHARVALADRITWRDGWPAIGNGKPTLGHCGR
jgi:beta-xylosidase